MSDTTKETPSLASSEARPVTPETPYASGSNHVDDAPLPVPMSTNSAQMNASSGWVERKTKLAAELGLTAVSRTRVAWTGHNQRLGAGETRPTKPKSELARLQDQAAALRRPVGVK